MGFVGRRDELAELAAGFEPGGAAVTLLEGAPGIGKTALLDAVLSDLPMRWRVVRVTAERDDAGAPWSTVRSVLADGLGDLAAEHHLPLGADLAWVTDRSAAGPGDPERAGYQFANLVGALTGLSDLAIAVDDYQWIDHASQAALGFAMRAGGRWLVAARTGGVSVPPDTRRVAVAALTLRDLDLLVRARLGAVWSPVELQRLADLSGGSPLYAEAILARDPDPADLVRHGAGTGIDELIDARVAALTGFDFEVLATLALMRRPELATLYRVFAGQATRSQVEDALEAGERAGVVRVVGDRVAFEHALVRDGVVARIDPSRLAATHRNLAGAFADPDDRTWHLGRGVEKPDEVVAAELAAAARRAAALGAPAEAVDLYERAATLTPTELESARIARIAAAGNAATDAGDFQRSIDLLERVVTGPVTEPIGVLARASYITAASRTGGPKPALDAVDAVLPFAGDAAERIDLLERRTRASLFVGLREARACADAALAEAVAAGDPDAVRRCRLSLDHIRSTLGEPVDLSAYTEAFITDPSAFTTGDSRCRRCALAN